MSNMLSLLILSVALSPIAAWLHVLAGNAAVSLLVQSFLPSREDTQPILNVATAISRFHPLPQEELLNSYSRGNSYLVMGKFDEALREFNHALEVSPNNAEVYISRGIANEKVLKWDQAIQDYRTANKLLKSVPFAPDDATCMSNIANAETGLGRWNDALKDFTYAIKLRPNFAAPQIGKALVLYQLGDTAEAFKYFTELIDTYDDFPDGLAATAVISNELNEKEQAREYWEQAIRIDERYGDVEWVRDIRRWPPRLVQSLVTFQRDLAKDLPHS